MSFAFCLSPWGQAWDRFFFDLLFLLRGSLSPPSDVVIVAIDEPSFGVLGKQWPWPRSLHAELMDILFDAGAKGVAFDLIFAEPSYPKEDDKLKEAIRRHPNLILGSDRHVIRERAYDEEIIAGPLPEFVAPQTKIGFINLSVDPDGFVRRMKLASGNLRSLAFLSAHTFLEGETGHGLQRLLATLDEGELYINLAGPMRTVKTVSYYQALNPQRHLPDRFFRDKLVFVGIATESLLNLERGEKGQYPIPYSRWGKGQMAGVEIHAHIASNLIHRTFLRQVSPPLTIFVGMIVGLFFAYLFFRVNPVPGGVLLASEALGSFIFAFLLFSHGFTYIPVLYLLAPATISYPVGLSFHYLEVWRERNFIRKAFSTYLSPSVVKQLIGQPERLRLGGERVEATVLFLDLAGFTSLSKEREPESLILLLNQYLGRFTEIIFRFEGMVDKYIGDGVMAVWGVPIAQQDHARRTCLAALEMGRVIQDLLATERMSAIRCLKARIGINSGAMVAGNVGATRHYNYTVVGDEVNLASRLEGINKIYSTTIILGENTAGRVEGDFELRPLDLIRLKGQEAPLKLYELQGMKGSLHEVQQEMNGLFEKGRRLYEAERWTEAREVFQRGASLGDGPCLVFTERCLLFEKEPPRSPWDGVFDLSKK